MKKQNPISPALLLQGICVAFVAMFLFSVILAIITMVSDWQESTFLLGFLNYLSIFIGGAYAGKHAHSKLWLNGALVGICYILLVTVLRTEINLLMQWALIRKVLLVGVIGLFGGLVGGIFSEE